VWINTHHWMLSELLRNLLHNAIRHTPHNGKLTIQLHSTDQTAQLTISDSGPGISLELRQRLFQPFSAGAMNSGSGLGSGHLP
jgi:two-component system, OmpR family, sensor histidine kinase TctE